MATLLCILTLGIDCPSGGDGWHEREPIARPSPAVPEPGAALLFGTGIAVAAIATRRRG